MTAKKSSPRKKQAVKSVANPAVPDAVLLSYQQKWIADKSDVKVCEKSRRIGISWGEAADDVLYSASVDGDDTHYIGYNREMAREFVSDCAFWAKHFQKAASEVEEFLYKDEDKDIISYRITFASGHEVVAHSSRPKNLRGKHGRVVIDEAAFHDDLDGLIAAAMALLMWGGQVRIISTHFGDSNSFNALVKEIRAGRRPFSLHRITFDEALEAGLYKRICLVTGKEWSPEAQTAYREDMYKKYSEAADEELGCVPSQGTGLYLASALVERCMEPAPILRISRTKEYAQLPEEERTADIWDWCIENLAPLLEKLDKERRHYVGGDFARSGDLSIFCPLTETKNLVWRVPFAVEMTNLPYKQQEQILFFICDRLPRFTHGSFDATGNGGYLAEVAMQKYGIERISQITINQKFYLENFPKYKAAFEDASIILPRDADWLDDHRKVKLVKGVPSIEGKHAEGKSGAQRHGDSAVAGLMAWHARGIDSKEMTAREIDMREGDEAALEDEWGEEVSSAQLSAIGGQGIGGGRHGLN